MSREEDLKKLEAMVNEVAGSMYLKLENKYDEGYRGWDDPSMEENLFYRLIKHFEKLLRQKFPLDDPENMLKIMNFLAMIRALAMKKADIKLSSQGEEEVKKRLDAEDEEEETKEIMTPEQGKARF